MTDIVVVTTQAITLDEAVSRLEQHTDREAGALVTFSGMVRATEGDGTIAKLDYEHYPGMAERQIGELIAEARRRWPIHRAGVWHRVGAVPVAESSVIVAVLSGHRGEAFDAARFLIDELKRSVPIWKSAPA